MVSHKNVLAQLGSLNLRFRIFGRSEVKELANVLNIDETIRHCIYGFYQGGSAILVATDARLLLIDKRPLFLNLEDIRYEMINDVNFAGRFLDATVSVFTGNKKLEFKSFTDARLRELCTFVQNQITKARQLEYMVEQVSPAMNEWKPYSLLPRPRISKYKKPIDNSSTPLI